MQSAFHTFTRRQLEKSFGPTIVSIYFQRDILQGEIAQYSDRWLSFYDEHKDAMRECAQSFEEHEDRFQPLMGYIIEHCEENLGIRPCLIHWNEIHKGDNTLNASVYLEELHFVTETFLSELGL